MAMSNEQAAAYLAGLIDGEGCVSLCVLKNGPSAGQKRRVVTIGMTDREIIDLAAKLFAQLGIGYTRSDRQPKDQKRKHVWNVAVTARKDIERFAALIPIQHQAKREKLALILDSYVTAAPYRRRIDHNSPAR